jgi:hypothetical protein
MQMDYPNTNGVAPMTGQNELSEKPLALPTPPPAQVEIDDSLATAHYANFCRLSGLPEELIIDFGLNLQSAPTQTVAMAERIVTGWHTAKRLQHVLQLTIERHEAAFGVLETDVQKRVQRT